MTVIKRPSQSYSHPNANAASDTESLHLAGQSTDDESLTNAPINRPFRQLQNRVFHIEELVNLKKSCGRKKLRRYQNRCVLQTLNEEEDNGAPQAFVVMEPFKSPFCRLLEDDDALEYWNSFIEKSEKEQTKILQAFSENFSKTDQEPTSTSKPFNRISPRIKRTIKIRKNLPLDLVKTSEDDLIEFFKNTPTEVYTKFPPTSFDRLLLHALAQYHGLKSISLFVNERKSVEIHNFKSDWIPADCFLSDFIAQLRR